VDISSFEARSLLRTYSEALKSKRQGSERKDAEEPSAVKADFMTISKEANDRVRKAVAKEQPLPNDPSKK